MITNEQIRELEALYNITNPTDTSWLQIFEFDDEISVKNNPIKARDALLNCLAFFIKKDGHIKGFYINTTILLTKFKMIQKQLHRLYAGETPQHNALMLYSYNGGNFSPLAFNTFLSHRTQLLNAVEYYNTNPLTPLNEQPFKALLTLAMTLGYKLDPRDPLGGINAQIAAEKTKKKSLK